MRARGLLLLIPLVAGCDRLLPMEPSEKTDARPAERGPDAPRLDRAGEASAADRAADLPVTQPDRPRSDSVPRDHAIPESGCPGCLTAGKCLAAGHVDPTDACRVCDPDLTPMGWGPAPGCAITLAGTGATGYQDGPALQATFSQPRGIAVGPDGAVYIADTGNHAIRRIAKGMVTTLVGGNGAGFADGPTNQAKLNEPRALTVDDKGTIFVADTQNDRIRKIDHTLVSTLVSVVGPLGVAWYAGKLYYTWDNRVLEKDLASGKLVWAAGLGKGCLSTDPVGCYSDGPIAQALFNVPRQLALLPGPKVIVADEYNNRIRAVTASVVSTVAGNGTAGSLDHPGDPLLASFNQPTGVATFGGIIYVADHNNHRIRRIAGGAVSTQAGSISGSSDGPLGKATFTEPRELAFDSAGRLYVVEDTGRKVRVLRLP